MDSDPFAVWDDPAPASVPSTSTAATKAAGTSSGDQAIKENVRLSLEYEDEDPGWGAPSSSASRANSPEKSKKQPPLSRTPSAILQVAETEAFEETSTSVAQNGATDALDQLEDAAAAATIPARQETAVAGVTEVKEPQAAADETNPTAKPADEDDDMDAFEESRQEPADHAEDGVSPSEFEQKTTMAEAPVAADMNDDGFDDFDEPVAGQQGASANDDFGDFDDFETGDAQNDADFGDDDFGDDSFDQPADSIAPAAPTESTSAPAPVAARTWAPLDVTSKSNRIDLADSVKSLFPLSAAAEQHLSSVGLRQVEGPSQVLVSGESRQLWIDLKTFPSMQPIDWVRSRTRRDYLISMGVPVNLDEIHSPFASGSGGSRQMPTLQLKYESTNNRASKSVGSNDSLPQRSSSLKQPGNGTPSSAATAAQRLASAANSPRNGNSSPALGSSTNRERMAERRMQELGLGPAPQVDLRRAQELMSKTEDQLTLLSLPALKSMLRELNTLTTSASSLLTHHLTLRESYQADSEMYNSMIKELVTGAASRFSSGGGSSGGSNSVAGGRGDSRRSTTMASSGSNPGKARVTSLPAGAAATPGSRSASPSLRGGAAASPRR